jgi:hypothetical protein
MAGTVVLLMVPLYYSQSAQDQANGSGQENSQATPGILMPGGRVCILSPHPVSFWIISSILVPGPNSPIRSGTGTTSHFWESYTNVPLGLACVHSLITLVHLTQGMGMDR